jgi:hypothetical protein
VKPIHWNRAPAVRVYGTGARILSRHRDGSRSIARGSSKCSLPSYMRSIPAFSKKCESGPTVGGGGQRQNFTTHVKASKATKERSVSHMAATYPVKSTLTRTTGPTPKATKPHSGQAAKAVPAFSKTKLSGVPKARR